MDSQRVGHRWRFLMGMVALALVPWGAAALTVGLGADDARAGAQDRYEEHELFLRVDRGGETFFVRIEMLLASPSGGTVDPAAVDAARAELLSRFPDAVALDTDGEVAAQYVTSGYKWMANTANYGYNNSGAPAAVSGAASFAVNASGSTWGSAGSPFSFTGGSPSGAAAGACGGGGTDGLNTVGWATQAGAVLAVTCTWFSNAGAAGGFSAATEFDMQIDPEWNWTTGTPIGIDLQSVVTHEFGHALGLNHSADGNAVMYASYSSGSNKRALTADDVNGIKAIYGASGGGSTPTNTPPVATNTPTTTPTRTPTPLPPTPTATATVAAPTATPTSVPATATPTATPPAATAAASPTHTPTSVPPTATATRSTTPESGSPTSTRTSTPAASATATQTPSAVPSATPTAPKLPLSVGANLLAWPGSNLAPGPAFAQANGLRMIYEWNPAKSEWKRWSPDLPAFANTLAGMRKGSSYWFIASSPIELPISQ